MYKIIVINEKQKVSYLRWLKENTYLNESTREILTEMKDELGDGTFAIFIETKELAEELKKECPLGYILNKL